MDCTACNFMSIVMIGACIQQIVRDGYRIPRSRWAIARAAVRMRLCGAGLGAKWASEERLGRTHTFDAEYLLVQEVSSRTPSAVDRGPMQEGLVVPVGVVVWRWAALASEGLATQRTATSARQGWESDDYSDQVCPAVYRAGWRAAGMNDWVPTSDS
jgi:hypothetical protein